MQQLDRIAKMLKMSLSDLLADDDALARNAVELSTLKKIREIPADKLPQAEALIAAVLDTLATPESDDD